MVQLSCSSIEELNEIAVEKADRTFDVENNPELSIPQLFAASAQLLKKARAYKEQKDWERCYGYLVQYLVLVKKKLPLHADIDQYAEEYEYNLNKCDVVKGELSNVKQILVDLYSGTTDGTSLHQDEAQFITVDPSSSTTTPTELPKTKPRSSSKKSVRPLPGITLQPSLFNPSVPVSSAHGDEQEQQEQNDSVPTETGSKRVRVMYLQPQMDPFYNPEEDQSHVVQDRVVRVPLQSNKQNPHVQFLGQQQINFRNK